jgi:hypothetical protein
VEKWTRFSASDNARLEDKEQQMVPEVGPRSGSLLYD